MTVGIRVGLTIAKVYAWSLSIPITTITSLEAMACSVDSNKLLAYSFVPFEMSKEIYRACNCPKAYLSVPGAGHGMSYVVDSRGYKEAVEKFLKISM